MALCVCGVFFPLVEMTQTSLGICALHYGSRSGAQCFGQKEPLHSPVSPSVQRVVYLSSDKLCVLLAHITMDFALQLFTRPRHSVDFWLENWSGPDAFGLAPSTGCSGVFWPTFTLRLYRCNPLIQKHTGEDAMLVYKHQPAIFICVTHRQRPFSPSQLGLVRYNPGVRASEKEIIWWYASAPVVSICNEHKHIRISLHCIHAHCALSALVVAGWPPHNTKQH